jgi:hypothetical protein
MNDAMLACTNMMYIVRNILYVMSFQMTLLFPGMGMFLAFFILVVALLLVVVFTYPPSG